MVINSRALNIQRSGLVLNRDKFNRPGVCSFTSCEFFVAGLGQFNSILVHLLCLLHILSKLRMRVTPIKRIHKTFA